MKIVPLIYASLLFFIIRVVNDVPAGNNYFSHSIGFIAIELAGLVGGSYLYFFVASRWIKICANRHICTWMEYLTIIIFSILLPLGVMWASHDVPLWDELPDIVIPVMITLLMSLLLYMILKNNYINYQYMCSKIIEKESQNERIKTELRLLRAQYHPHFLFNMLNTIYFIIDENNVIAKNTIEHLADFLRLQLYVGDEPVPVEKEISAIESYIELCRTRYGDSIEINTSIDTRYSNERIHPYLLLPLVENAFKYAGGTPKRISINLMRSLGSLDFKVENTLSKEHRSKASDDCSGIGLTNLQRRLELLYPGRYNFANSEESYLYSTHLHIEL